MGAATSENQCVDVCLQACPALQTSSGSEMARRQKMRDDRKKMSAGARLRAGSKEKGGDLEETGIGGTLSRFKTNAGKYWAGEMALNEVLSTRRMDDGDPEAAAGEDLRARLMQVKVSPDDDLQHGAMRGELKKVKRALDQRANPTQANVRGVTPLMLSSSSSGREALEVLKELFDKKSDLHARDNNGWMVIHHACRNGKVEAARFLLTLNSDPTKKTHDDKTTLMLTTIEGKTDLVKELLKIKTVKPQIPEKDALGATALHYAVKEGNLEITRCLIEHNAKVSSKDIDARTPLMWAAEQGKLECVRTLHKKSAELDTRDKCHRSALLYACLHSYEGVALWLVKKGADPYQPDVAGESPLTVADDMGLADLKRTVKMLRLQMEDEEG